MQFTSIEKYLGNVKILPLLVGDFFKSKTENKVISKNANKVVDQEESEQVQLEILLKVFARIFSIQKFPFGWVKNQALESCELLGNLFELFPNVFWAHCLACLHQKV